jgi:hypothetical protein
MTEDNSFALIRFTSNTPADEAVGDLLDDLIFAQRHLVHAVDVPGSNEKSNPHPGLRLALRGSTDGPRAATLPRRVRLPRPT